MRRTITAWATLLLAVAFAAAPFVTEPFQGYDGNQLPVPQDSPPIQPAGWAFSIWGIIYLWLIVSAAFGLKSRGDDPEWEKVRGPLLIALAVGVPWLAVANESALLATVMIFLMAGGAIAALLRTPIFDRWTLRHPVGLFAGWLTAASFVSLGATAAGYGLVLGPTGWAWVCLPLALLVAAAVQSRPQVSPAYGIAVIWALTGIMVKNAPAGASPGIATLALLGILLIAALILRPLATRLLARREG
ncbi:hypothetical protein [Pelagovum pacificum]|uniref:Tryptophan-rich sensory protein n=1 Tax=Pelagovum pacificum TaxID=2588711 RepID=A0A5C5GE25_9RHOB|nr:hypothetical protein [Pelagovum pacificum]QQA44438.1 hypothetical protein I8N54_07675 [Pelagovum pacificum]TNY32444.1 hypothetical protein FHY64_03900 [Pelagovum pacificum]